MVFTNVSLLSQYLFVMGNLAFFVVLIGQCFCFTGGFGIEWEMECDDQTTTRITNISGTVGHIFLFLTWVKGIAILLFFFSPP